MRADLERGIAEGQLRLHFQPLMGAHSRQCVGFEALVRWQHPDQGLLWPGAFVPLAESGPLIAPLTEWVLEEALVRCADWRTRGRLLTVSVNLSARLLTDRFLPDRVATAMARYELPPHALTLEVTESALVERPGAALELLRDLRRRGIRVSVDDFGTGYTSLAMLKQFEFDELKIDGSFVSAMLASPADAAIVQSVVDLGHRLGSQVVAEQVQDEATARLLAEFGCDVLQGFYLAHPSPVTEALGFVDRTRPRTTDMTMTSSKAIPAAIPANETARLAALRDLDILDSDAEMSFDDIAAVAAAVCGTSVGLVTFVDEDRQWFKARVGLDVPQTDRDSAFCAHAILRDSVMEVSDAHGDARFASNPFVIGAPHVRFYAGAPLVTSEGLALGTLCVLDAKPHTLSVNQRDTLERLARIVVEKLRARRTELTLRRLATSLMTLSNLHDPADVNRIADTIVHAARQLLSADGAFLALAETASAVMYTPVGASTRSGLADVALGVVIDSRLDGAAGAAIETRSPVFVADAATSELIDPGLVSALNMQSVLYVPVIREGGGVGVLVTWWSTQQRDLDATSHDAAVLLAAEAGTTLSRLHALAALRQAADTDTLTGLANRRACLAALGQLPPNSAVIIVDLDRFKAINDERGHQAGDHTLKAFAAHLRAAVRTGDLVGRWGGEEFLVALPHGGTTGGVDMLARLRHTWSPPAASTTFSAGMAVLGPTETVNSVLGRADQALYAAKDQGRDRDVVNSQS